jgi:hypothetical protein
MEVEDAASLELPDASDDRGRMTEAATNVLLRLAVDLAPASSSGAVPGRSVAGVDAAALGRALRVRPLVPTGRVSAGQYGLTGSRHGDEPEAVGSGGQVGAEQPFHVPEPEVAADAGCTTADEGITLRFRRSHGAGLRG